VQRNWRRCKLQDNTYSNLEKTFSPFPLINSSSSEDITKRLDALENFLKEYVVDVGYLEKLKEREIPSISNNNI